MIHFSAQVDLWESHYQKRLGFPLTRVKERGSLSALSHRVTLQQTLPRNLPGDMGLQWILGLGNESWSFLRGSILTRSPDEMS